MGAITARVHGIPYATRDRRAVKVEGESVATIRTSEQLEETSRRGLEFYNERIKPLLSDADDGRFLAIDANTGEYEIGDSEWEVVEDLKAQLPDADVLVLVHPRVWVHAIGGGTRSGIEG